MVASAEGALVVTAIVASDGYNSARLWFAEGGGSWQEPTELLAKAGCVVEVYSERLVGASWPEQSNVLPLLDRLEAEGSLQYATA